MQNTAVLLRQGVRRVRPVRYLILQALPLLPVPLKTMGTGKDFLILIITHRK